MHSTAPSRPPRPRLALLLAAALAALPVVFPALPHPHAERCEHSHPGGGSPLHDSTCADDCALCLAVSHAAAEVSVVDPPREPAPAAERLAPRAESAPEPPPPEQPRIRPPPLSRA